MLTVEQVRQLPADYHETIPASYLDEMGHMNIQYYMAIFNTAVFHFYKRIGMDMDYFLKGDGGVVALQHFIRYLAEVHVGETVAVHHRLVGRSAKRLHFMQFMINESTGKLACTLEILNSHFNTAVRRTSPYPPKLNAIIDPVLAAHRQLTWEAPVCGVIKP